MPQGDKDDAPVPLTPDIIEVREDIPIAKQLGFGGEEE